MIDVTDRIEEYENGKTWSCDCGQDFGVPHSVEQKRCPCCGEHNVDKLAPERPTLVTLDDYQ